MLLSPPLVSPESLPPESIRSARQARDATEAFLLALAKALHRRGIPAHRLEGALHTVAATLGREVLVLATPTAVQLAFERRGHQRVHLLREEPGAVDLGRICDLNELIDDVGKGRVDPVAATARLAQIESSLPSFGPIPVTLSFAAASGTAACFFGATPVEIVASTTLGLCVGLLSLVSSRHPAFGRVFEPLAAFSSVLAAAILATLVPLSVDRVALASVIALVPGFTLTVAMSELAVRHLASGVARLAGAVTTFLAIGLGVGIGRKLAVWLPSPLDAPIGDATSIGSLIVPLMVASVAFLVLFQARRKDLVWLVGAGGIAFFAARGGALLLGTELGTFVGAAAVGLYGNGLARIRRLPATVPQVPGIMLLVPGSLGFRAVDLLLVNDVLSGVETAFRMFLVAISLVGGLLAANVIVPPQRDL